ncbi:MAG: UDP-N-acetylmuramate dehydrogenase [Clostridia bacterium]|nr:UDP-N-acetylmuramate dehydrogenase [Clostridia bacterium]
MELYSLLLKELRRSCPALELRENEPMSRHTTFHIGGPARLMALPKSAEEAEAVVRAAVGLGVEPLFMGNGSDLLVADAGVDRFLIKAMDGLSAMTAEENEIWAESGAVLAKVALFARDRGLGGFEFAHGIPGSVGGAVTMNAGAYGGEMSQVVTGVDYLTAAGERGTLFGPELGFTYRHSAFSDGKRMILGARLSLKRGDSAAIGALMEELMRKRKSKQPLEYPSGGSTFKRPAGYFAAALIDECGLKGRSVGGAEVSKKHAGFVINKGGATCDDVLRLVEEVRETVLRETGVLLELELKTLGI